MGSQPRGCRVRRTELEERPWGGRVPGVCDKQPGDPPAGPEGAPPGQEGSRKRPCHLGLGGFCMSSLYPEVLVGGKLQRSGQRDVHNLSFMPDSSVTNGKDLQSRGL